MILTPVEVNARLAKNGSDVLDGDNDLSLVVWPSVEAFVKRATRRNFESTDYAKYYNILPHQRSLLLDDYPVSVFTKLEEVTEVDTDGNKTLETIEAGDYEVDLASGILYSTAGDLPSGISAVKATFTAGYTADQLLENTESEVLILKSLLLSILSREYAINKDNKRHLRSHSWGDESTTYNFDLTFNEERALNMLKRRS